MNIVIVSGKLKDEPKMKEVANGHVLANFGLEMKGKDKDGGEKISTMYFTAWNNEAKKLQGLGAGYPVVLRGSLQNRKRGEGENAEWHLEAGIFEVEVLA